MANQTPTFQARVYSTPESTNTHIVLMWGSSGKSFIQKIKVKSEGQTIMVQLLDGKDYIVTFYPYREEMVKVYEDDLFSVEPCEVKVKKKENVSLA